MTLLAAAVTQSPPVKTFDALFAELSERARTRPAGSGTVAALDGGCARSRQEDLEEAGEVWLAAEHESAEALADEISQLLYWTQVLIISRGLSLDGRLLQAMSDMLRVRGAQQGCFERVARRSCPRPLSQAAGPEGPDRHRPGEQRRVLLLASPGHRDLRRFGVSWTSGSPVATWLPIPMHRSGSDWRSASAIRRSEMRARSAGSGPPQT